MWVSEREKDKTDRDRDTHVDEYFSVGLFLFAQEALLCVRMA